MTEVVAGILFNKKGQMLISSRPEGKSFAHYWEFPGGKLEKGEGFLEALYREFKEELDLDVKKEDWQFFQKKTNDHLISLSFFICKSRALYEVRPLEGQNFRWIAKEEADHFLFLPGNADVLSSLKEKTWHYLWQEL